MLVNQLQESTQNMKSEKAFEQKVKQFLNDNGCWVLKTWSNGIQRKGVPDLLTCVKGMFVAIELKAANGKPSSLQLWNVEQIRAAGGIAIVLYPDQFDEFKDMIIRILLGNSDASKIQYIFDRKVK